MIKNNVDSFKMNPRVHLFESLSVLVFFSHVYSVLFECLIFFAALRQQMWAEAGFYANNSGIIMF